MSLFADYSEPAPSGSLSAAPTGPDHQSDQAPRFTEQL